MMWLTLRRAVVTGAVLLTVVATGCSGDDERDRTGGGGASTGAATGSDTTAPVETVVTLGNLGKGVGDAKRERIKTSLVAALDPWFDGAWLGEFPRSDYAPAFAAFTPGAARDAQRDLAMLSNQAISDRIDTATATRRKVRLDVFSHDGHPRGGTVQFLLDFDTTGTLAESRRVTGRLYVTRSEGQWQVFGYDVDEAVAQ